MYKARLSVLPRTEVWLSWPNLAWIIINSFVLRNSRGGGWSTDGCWLASRDSGTITCKCDHLTNFAILMDTSGISSVSKTLFLNYHWDIKEALPQNLSNASYLFRNIGSRFNDGWEHVSQNAFSYCFVAFPLPLDTCIVSQPGFFVGPAGSQSDRSTLIGFRWSLWRISQHKSPPLHSLSTE